ncbi:parallel beta-helix repeat (two copies) [Leptolyngbya sp. PCC 7375]|nr:parallel beta-helix repeat (two copies) [Leptolyngbya sp. PCC 7375]
MNATKRIKQHLLDRVVLLSVATLMTTLPARAQAQHGSTAQNTISMSQASQSYGVLHINATTGIDVQGSGSAEQPYKTITQALRMAPTNTSTVILLAPGHYSQESGEQFPLRLRPGITIQGNAGQTRNTIITGGGDFHDGNGTQNATILTADRSGLANVAISNAKGNGVWISAGSPILRRVALVANAVAGIQITHGDPVIENSYFNRNQYGLSIQGNSRALVRGNYFEATGRAITVANPATPVINNNRITRNEVGIALKNNARPVLEANVLDDNGRNGVVEVDTTTAAIAENSADIVAVKVSEVSHETRIPTVSAQERAAVFTRPESNPNSSETNSSETNGSDTSSSLDVQAETTELAQPEADIPATDLAINQATADSNLVVEGLSETHEPDDGLEQVNTATHDNDTGEPTGEPTGELTGEPTGAIASYRQHLAISSAAPAPVNIQASLTRQPPSSEANEIVIDAADEAAPNATEDIAVAPTETGADDDAIPIAVIPASAPNINQNSSSSGHREGVSKLLARLNGSPEPASSPRAENSRDLTTPDVLPDVPTATTNGERLPVPSIAIPSRSGSLSLTPPGSVALTETFRYRVLVDMADAEKLQSLVPDAFRTQMGSQVFMQAGAYVNEADAQEHLEWLEENGIDGQVNLRN